MAATPYKYVSFTSDTIPQAKLEQMANNDNWLFENMTKVRLATPGLTRDNGLKIISGKTPFPAQTTGNRAILSVYFGSFFATSCKPVVVASVEGQGGAMHYAHHVLQGLSGEIDSRGFIAIVANQTTAAIPAGWVHWTATGY